MRKTVAVIMSTYNGSKHIRRQLDSIFLQKGVDIRVFIRDDNSLDNTVTIIEDYILENPDRQIDYITGMNEGYAKSFWDALCAAGEADYYAFSDQDDVWKEDKLIKTIAPMEESDYPGPKLSYCKMVRSDEQLHCLDEQVVILKPGQLSKKLCLTRTFNYGAATVFNHELKELICRCWPDRDDVPHDLWAGLLGYWFGRVTYVDESLYYWIRYGTSVTGEGTKKSGKRYRMMQSLKKKSYPNVAGDLLENYKELLSDDEKSFLKNIVNYRTSIKARMTLLADRGFKRDNVLGTIALKTGILLGWF